MEPTFPNAEALNPGPFLYQPFLRQYARKLKSMQDAFLAGDDLALYLEDEMFGRFPFESRSKGFSEAVGPLAIALCWSFVVPDILKPVPVPAAAARAKNRRDISVPQAGGPPGNVLQGELCSLEGWMKGWRASSWHQEMIKTSVSRTSVQELVSSKYGVSITGHADFGLKRVGWPSAGKPAIPYDRPVPQYFRTLIVWNAGPQPVVLLDVCGVPSLDKTFTLHDDYGLAHHYETEYKRPSAQRGSSGVTIMAGAQYQVTAELRCNEEDIALHQQWLLFVFVNENQDIFVIGRRVSAVIGHNIQDVQRCLSTEAKPFYPAYLRSLFDNIPRIFNSNQASAMNENVQDQRMQMPAAYQTYMLSLWPERLRYSEAMLYSAPLASPCKCAAKQLRQLARLLALEEVAMERDIKEYDMFNVELTHYKTLNFALEVPGLPENRPSVFIEDVVYIRLERDPQMECAAKVTAVQLQPTPRLILLIPESFRQFTTYPGPVAVHARFSFDRLFLTRMFAALLKVEMASTKLLPCICCKETWAAPSPIQQGNEISSMTPSPTSDTSWNLPANLDRPEVESTPRNYVSQPLVYKNTSLNTEQKGAVEKIANHVPGSGPYVILGPPGTGKTVTMVECVLQILSRDPSAILLVCAPSNWAADILCSGIAAGGVNSTSMWRMNDPRRTQASIKSDVHPFCHVEVLSSLSEEKLIFKVIVCTCAAAGMFAEYPLCGRVRTFTHILIDEAGQALIPESLIPLSLGNPSSCYVLCGDPKQLGPVVHSRIAAENGLSDTLIGRFQALAEDTSNPQKATCLVVTKLVHNYRANGKLLELPSKMFYNNQIIASAPASETAPPHNWNELKGRDFPILFYGVKGQQMREGESPSYFNPVEAGKVADLIVGFITDTKISALEIGVMAPYRRQVYKLRMVLRARNLGSVRVGTVDDYQGQEARVVFISTVLTHPDSSRQMKSTEQTGQIGFLSNAKRFNVAITRAKAMLVVVGHPLVLALDDNWRELLSFCLARDAFRGYGSEFVVPAFYPLKSSNSMVEDNFTEMMDEDEQSRNDALETAKAIEKMAEISLLGMGDVDKVYPVNLDSMYSAFSEETEWRIQL